MKEYQWHCHQCGCENDDWFYLQTTCGDCNAAFHRERKRKKEYWMAAKYRASCYVMVLELT